MYKRLKLALQSVCQFRIKEIELLRQRNAELEQQLQHSTTQLQDAKAAVERQRKQAALLNQIVHRMRETLVLDEILQIAANQLHSALNVSRCQIFRPDADSQLGIRYVCQSTSEGNCLIGLQCDFYRYYQTQLMSGEPLVLPPIEASEPREFLKALENCNIRALMIVPLIYQQHFIGGISLNECRGERDWTSDEVEFVKSIADHCAIAIHQAELYQQAQTELQERHKVQVALRESNELFQQLTENIHQGFFVTDLQQNKLLYANPAFKEICGFDDSTDLAEVLIWAEGYCSPVADQNYSFFNPVHPEDRSLAIAALDSLKSGQPHYCEYRIIRPDGDILWVSTCRFPLKDDQGEVYRITGIVEDITERKTAEWHLHQQAERERLIRMVTQRIRQSLNLDDILTTTVAQVRHLLQTDRVLVFQIEPDGSGFVLEESVGDGWQALLGQNIFDSCFPSYIEPYRQGRVRAIADIDDGSILSCHADFLRHFDVRANLVVPILFHDHLWGLLIAHHCAHSRQWSIGETELLKQVADQVAIAIQQAQLYKQVQHELADRIQAETFLRESEARFRLMADSAPVLIWLADSQGECTFFNQTWLKFTGRSLARELRGSWTESILPSDLEHYLDMRTTAIRAKNSFFLEYRLRRKDGEYRWILEKAVPRLTPGGELLGYIGSCIDITQRKQVEAKLQKLNEELEIKVQERTQELQQTVDRLAEEIVKHCHTETQLTIALEAAFMGTWDWNLLTNHLNWSPRTQSIFGLAPGSFSGTQQAFINSIHPEDLPAVGQSIQEALLNNTPLNCETRILLPDGNIRWIAYIGNVICDRAGQPQRMTGVVIDIHDRKLAEKALRTSLKEKEVLLKEIHHRVKNNLQIISSLLKLQSSYIKDEQVIALFSESYNRVRSMALIHENLYHSHDLARVDADDYISHLANNLFNSYNVDSHFIDLNISIASLKLDIDTAIPCGLIINELVSNSLKYAFSGRQKGILSISFFSDDNQTLFLQVRDDGVGLPPDFDIEQIQSLGLQLVLNLTEQLTGKLEIDSTNGTSFTITFVPQTLFPFSS
ncbi:PAS domain-containing protein [Floridanema aerugineum]|uniref:histidine kinase n=1 Tax=Floridaenema aerugineum BLCC-F46 TaxID=3153654 RepID=A0ABV4X7M0_9CYAN